jgi:hypothetical protein
MGQLTSPSACPTGHLTVDYQQMRDNSDLRVNPSNPQATPTCPPNSPYMEDHHSQHMGQPLPHKHWAGYPPQHGMPGPYPHPGGPGVQGPPQTSAASRPEQVWKNNEIPLYDMIEMLTGIRVQVYTFTPIPGGQSPKRPRRHYDEIERMYKCGWNGCEKAYGTLNHLNAHVTMQSHGTKRTPEGTSFAVLGEQESFR